MLPPKRRFLIILGSVTLGSAFAAFIMKRRFGTLSQENVNQLIFNFIFAAGIVVGIGILLSRMNRNRDKSKE